MHLPTALIMISSGFSSDVPVLCRAVSAVKIDAFSQFPDEEEVHLVIKSQFVDAYSVLYSQFFSGVIDFMVTLS